MFPRDSRVTSRLCSFRLEGFLRRKLDMRQGDRSETGPEPLSGSQAILHHPVEVVEELLGLPRLPPGLASRYHAALVLVPFD